jgi:hypothetical protein
VPDLVEVVTVIAHGPASLRDVTKLLGLGAALWDWAVIMFSVVVSVASPIYVEETGWPPLACPSDTKGGQGQRTAATCG